jgi:hypothetical protein
MHTCRYKSCSALVQGNCAHTVETEVVVDLQKGRPQAPSEPAALAGDDSCMVDMHYSQRDGHAVHLK